MANPGRHPTSCQAERTRKPRLPPLDLRSTSFCPPNTGPRRLAHWLAPIWRRFAAHSTSQIRPTLQIRTADRNYGSHSKLALAATVVGWRCCRSAKLCMCNVVEPLSVSRLAGRRFPVVRHLRARDAHAGRRAGLGRRSPPVGASRDTLLDHAWGSSRGVDAVVTALVLAAFGRRLASRATIGLIVCDAERALVAVVVG